MSISTFRTKKDTASARLRIIATTDIHSDIGPTDCDGNPCGLLSSRATIDKLRADVPNSLLLDNGDTIQGSLISELAHQRGWTPHPVVSVMNGLEYDCANLGNHDFDYGIDFLKQAYSSANFSVICGNLELGANDLGFQKHVILGRNIQDEDGVVRPIKIGLLGFVPPSVAYSNSNHLAGTCKVLDIVETARTQSKHLASLGADITICLAHSGVGKASAKRDTDNVAGQVAALPLVDAVIAGHDHQKVALDSIKSKTTSLVQPGHSSRYIGLIDLDLEYKEAKWNVLASKSRIEKIVHEMPSAIDLQPTAKMIGQTHKHVRKTIGKTNVPLHGYFFPLMCTPINQLLADAQRWYLETVRPELVPPNIPLVFSSTVPFSTHKRSAHAVAHIPVGKITNRHIYQIAPFNDEIILLHTTVGGLSNWINNSFRCFNQTEAYKTISLFDGEYSPHDFDCIDGATFNVHLEQDPIAKENSRVNTITTLRPTISNLSVGGTERGETDPVILTTTQHRISGAGSFPVEGLSHWTSLGLSNRAVLQQFFAENGTYDNCTNVNWTYSGSQGSHSTFRVPKDASDYISTLDLLGLRTTISDQIDHLEVTIMH